MERSEDIAAKIVKIVEGGAPHRNSTIEMLIKGYACDVANMCKNIRETSFSSGDRTIRLELLSKQTGMSIWDLNKLT